MKKLVINAFVAVIALCCSMNVSAMVTKMKVTTDTGKEYTVALNQMPKVTFDNFAAVLTTEKEVIYFEKEETVEFAMIDPTGIEGLIASEVPTFYWDENTLHIFGLGSGEQVELFNVGGQKLTQCNADENGHAQIDLSSHNGVLIAAPRSIKAIKFSKN